MCNFKNKILNLNLEKTSKCSKKSLNAKNDLKFKIVKKFNEGIKSVTCRFGKQYKVHYNPTSIITVVI